MLSFSIFMSASSPIERPSSYDIKRTRPMNVTSKSSTTSMSKYTTILPKEAESQGFLRVTVSYDIPLEEGILDKAIAQYCGCRIVLVRADRFGRKIEIWRRDCECKFGIERDGMVEV